MIRIRLSALLAALLALSGGTALAQPAFTCGGFAMLGGAQLVCSHVDPEAPAQFCNFSWDLMGTATGQTVIGGSFLLTPGLTNATVYQGSGFSYALSNPIVLCQARKGL